MNSSAAVGCPVARPGPAPQRRSPDERQGNCYISWGICNRLVMVWVLTRANSNWKNRYCARLTAYPDRMGTAWGDVPTWVGAIITSGTLLLGMVILTRDQARQRGEFISQVSYWARIGLDGKVYAYLDNKGTLPIKVIMEGREDFAPLSIRWGRTATEEPLTLQVSHLYFVPPGSGFKVSFQQTRERGDVSVRRQNGGAILYDPLGLTVVDNMSQAWISTPSGWKRVKITAAIRRVLAGRSLPPGSTGY